MLIFLKTKLDSNSIGEAQDNFVENIIMEFKIIVKITSIVMSVVWN